MTDWNVHITAGLPVAKNSGQSPVAGEHTVYVSAGLAPEVLVPAAGGSVPVKDHHYRMLRTT